MAQTVHNRSIESQECLSERISGLTALCLCGLIAGLCLGAVCMSRNSSRLAAVRDTINPNTATVESLVRLAGIGASRAQQIVDYRQTHRGASPAFGSAQDLLNIRGFGPKTVEAIAPSLDFETANPATESND